MLNDALVSSPSSADRNPPSVAAHESAFVFVDRESREAGGWGSGVELSRYRPSASRVYLCYSEETGKFQAGDVRSLLTAQGLSVTTRGQAVDLDALFVVDNGVMCIVLTDGVFADPVCRREMSLAIESSLHIVGVVDKESAVGKTDVDDEIARCKVEDAKEGQAELLKILYQTEFQPYRKSPHEAKAMVSAVVRQIKQTENKGPWEAYLCHTHRTGGEQARVLRILLTEQGLPGFAGKPRLKVWFDKDMSKIDVHSMEEGVRDSQVFILFLTTGLMSREYCQKELKWALDYRKPIVVVMDNNDDQRKLHGECSVATERVAAGSVDDSKWTSDRMSAEELQALFTDMDEPIPYRTKALEVEAMLEELKRRMVQTGAWKDPVLQRFTLWFVQWTVFMAVLLGMLTFLLVATLPRLSDRAEQTSLGVAVFGNPCASDPCQNGGTCSFAHGYLDHKVHSVSRLSCQCAAGFVSTDCSAKQVLSRNCQPLLVPHGKGGRDFVCNGVIGHVCTPQCGAGFAPHGSATCDSATNKFIGRTMPSCQPLPCASKAVKYATGVCAGVTGSPCSINCIAGYQFRGTLKCNGATSSFTGDGACLPSTCVQRTPAYASIACEGVTGDVCNPTCPAGYSPRGSFTCSTDGKFVGSASCMPVSCPGVAIANGKLTGQCEGATYEGAGCSFGSCNPGFFVAGFQGQLACTANGTWSPAPSARCLPYKSCPDVKLPCCSMGSAGTCKGARNGDSCAHQGCTKPGYKLVGTQGNGKCGADGKWSPEPPVCAPLQCKPFHLPQAARLNEGGFCSGKTTDVCRPTCLPGFTLKGSLTCGTDSRFAGDAVCQPDPCKPLNIGNSSTCVGNTTERCLPKCGQGYTLIGSLTCGVNHTFSGDAVCQPNKCTEVTIPNAATVCTGTTLEKCSLACKPGYELCDRPYVPSSGANRRRLQMKSNCDTFCNLDQPCTPPCRSWRCVNCQSPPPPPPTPPTPSPTPPACPAPSPPSIPVGSRLPPGPKPAACGGGATGGSLTCGINGTFSGNAVCSPIQCARISIPGALTDCTGHFGQICKPECGVGKYLSAPATCQRNGKFTNWSSCADCPPGFTCVVTGAPFVAKLKSAKSGDKIALLCTAAKRCVISGPSAGSLHLVVNSGVDVMLAFVDMKGAPDANCISASASCRGLMAINSGSVTGTSLTFSGGIASDGGAVTVGPGLFECTDCVFTGNTATGHLTNPGAVTNSGGTLRLICPTFSDNTNTVFGNEGQIRGHDSGFDCSCYSGFCVGCKTCCVDGECGPC